VIPIHTKSSPNIVCILRRFHIIDGQPSVGNDEYVPVLLPLPTT
jgi:hypothetical protein